VQDYILFVDTETTGYPSGWTAPYSIDARWPHIVQLAWVLYDNQGKFIKGESHYLKPPTNKLTASSIHVHGLNDQFLSDNGEDPKQILKLFYSDLKIYNPLVVGHYIRFDFHILGANFYRYGLANPLINLQTFCTMLSVQPTDTAGIIRYQRLNEVYFRLFHAYLEKEHDAWIDASATARVFFELLQKNEITPTTIFDYPQLSQPLNGNTPISFFKSIFHLLSSFRSTKLITKTHG
jgi:DNA polymerase-3 subunit epsilon